MYIHAGNGFVLKDSEIVGIFDIEVCSLSKKTRQFLSSCQRNDMIVDAAEDLPKSFIVTKDKTYISGVAAATLRQRAEKGSFNQYDQDAHK